MAVALLLAGTAAAMVLTQHLRHDGPGRELDPWKTRPGPRYRVCFRLTRDDTVKVAVVDRADHVVRVLAPTQPLKGGDTAHCFDWDGRTDAGQPVPPGPLPPAGSTLEDADRVAISGSTLTDPGARRRPRERRARGRRLPRRGRLGLAARCSPPIARLRVAALVLAGLWPLALIAGQGWDELRNLREHHLEFAGGDRRRRSLVLASAPPRCCAGRSCCRCS